MKIASFEKREWIDAWRDRRPMTEDEVLVTAWHLGEFIGCIARYDQEIGEWMVPFPVLAWMPLPEPYNPVEEE